MKKAIIAAVFLGLALTLFAADSGKVIMATTDDGRKVVLLPDGTWKWVDIGSNAPTPKGAKDEDWQKIISYLTEQGYTIKNNDGVSKTLTTEWHNQVVPSLTQTSGIYKGNRMIMVQPTKLVPMVLVLEWTITCILKDDGPSLIFNYRWHQPAETVPAAGVKMSDYPAPDPKGLDCKGIKSCIENRDKTIANEKAIKDGINALLKSAPAPSGPAPAQEKKEEGK